jgi:quercetin dioxygenase-like cupin family protein
MGQKQIKVLEPGDAVVFEEHGMISRRLVRSDHGSENMSFHVTTMPEGFDDPAVVYPDHDEIVYMLSGTVELTVEDTGERTLLSAGMAFFIPRGAGYGYRVTEGPNEIIAVFSPAKV